MAPSESAIQISARSVPRRVRMKAIFRPSVERETAPSFVPRSAAPVTSKRAGPSSGNAWIRVSPIRRPGAAAAGDRSLTKTIVPGSGSPGVASDADTRAVVTTAMTHMARRPDPVPVIAVQA